MSSSVWFRELSIALLKELKDTIKVCDSNDKLSGLSDKAFIVRKPEEDFKIETFPCVSIYYKDYKYDPRRHNPIQLKEGIDIDNKTITLEDSAIPFNISLQIDFWSRYQSDMDSMTHSWLIKHYRQFNLKVLDENGVERNCNVFRANNNTSITKSDLVLNKERLFHSIINYIIWVELDDETRYNVPMVTERRINY